MQKMRLNTKLVPACAITPNSFIYDEKKKMWFFVDDIDIVGNKTMLYFEHDQNTEVRRTYSNIKMVRVLIDFQESGAEYTNKEIYKRLEEVEYKGKPADLQITLQD